MNRNRHFDYIEEKLNFLSLRIARRGKLNLLDLHGHSENFYLHFFNLLFGWNLTNMNSKVHNVEAIDLVDEKAKVIIQVSATCTKQKIDSSLSKPILQGYPGYVFHFISISKDASNLRKLTYDPPKGLNFTAITNIHDVVTLLKKIEIMDVFALKEIYLFIKAELGNEPDAVRLESNLAAIIKFLSQEDWNESEDSSGVNKFEIERKILFNELKISQNIIHEHCIHHPRIDAIYSEFDKKGINKSKSVLAAIRREYLKLIGQNPDLIFSKIAEQVNQRILSSANFEKIPVDELELSVDLLVVDAFIRCKIFENPVGYSYASS